MGMQTDQDSDSPFTVDGGASPVAPCPTGYGGNMTLINQNEAEVIEASYEHTAIQHAPGGYDENLSTTQGAFRFPAL